MWKNVKAIIALSSPLLVLGLLLYICWMNDHADQGGKSFAKSLCDQMAAPAVVLAGFSTAAFHLRFRLIDGIAKLDKRSQVEHMTTVFRECRKNIDYCLLAFALTTILMVVGKFHGCIHPNAYMFIVAIAGGSFVHCMVKFMQILDALRHLEDFTLSRMKESAKYN